MIAHLVAALVLHIPADAPPASTANEPPAASQPAAPPLLSGPAAAEDQPGRPTLVQRTFDGKIEDIGGEPDAVAIGMLDLTPEQRAKFDAINAARMSAFDMLVRDNYGLILEVAALQGGTNAAQRLEVLNRAATAFKPYADRGTFLQEMWPALRDDQRQQAEAMVKEYRDARNQALRAQMTETASLRSLASLDRLQTFGRMVRESIERQIGLERESFDAIASELALTPEQRNAAEAIFQPLAIKRFQNIAVSREEQSAAFAEFNKLLTAGQKQKVFGILLRQYQNQPAPATKPTAPSNQPTTQSYKSEAGPFAVIERLHTLTDEARDRDVPVKAFLPKREVAQADPVVILSPGWGGSREGYAYLARHWASHGYAVIVLEHDGSDGDFARQSASGATNRAAAAIGLARGMRASVNDPANWSTRALDVTLTLDELDRRNGLAGDDFHGRLDLTRVGMSGHSFGAYTTMLIMGARVDLPGESDRAFRDSRCVAGIAMSSQGDGRLGLDGESWAGMTAPMLYLTGTLDFELDQKRSAAGRRVAFDRTPADTADAQMLITIKDAEHNAFGDSTRDFSGEAMQRDPDHHPWILMATTAFWDAHLRGDADANAWLAGDALVTISNGDCVVERK